MPEHPLATLEKIDPVMTAHLREEDALLYGPGALSRKIKLLMAMAFDAAHGAPDGVRALAAAAVKEGATSAEVAEALRMAYHLSGVGSLYAASRGLKDLFQP